MQPLLQRDGKFVCTLQPAQRAQRAVGPNKPNAWCSNLLHKRLLFGPSMAPSPASQECLVYSYFFCSFICRGLAFFLLLVLQPRGVYKSGKN